MPFDIDGDLNPPVRFPWKDTGEWVEFRVPSEEDKDRLRKEAKVGVKRVEMVLNPKTQQMERIEYRDSSDEARQAYVDALLDLSISDWNIWTTKKDPIPCTRQNKLRLVKGMPEFDTWARDCIDKVTAHEAGEKAQEIPNS